MSVIKIDYNECSRAVEKMKTNGRLFQDAVFKASLKVEKLASSQDFRTDLAAPKFVEDFQSFVNSAMECGAGIISLGALIDDVYQAFKDTDAKFGSK